MRIEMVKGGASQKTKKMEDESDSDEEPRDDREYLNNQMFRYKH